MKNRTIARFMLLALTLGLLITGILLSQQDIVFRKASVICMECIGIG